jgi:hypothetical protein
MVTTDEGKAEALCCQYESVWSTEEVLMCMDHGPIEYISCSTQWAYNKLRNLKSNKATGPDGIPAMFIKSPARVLAPTVANLITRSSQEGSVPLDWKDAVVIPIPKIVGSDKASDYRPVSLTCILSKIAESFISESISAHVNSLLPETQYGFRENRGTVDALIDAEFAIMSCLR